MKRIGKLCFVLLLIVSNITGCWNLKEPDQLAFIVGAGIDFTKDGQFQLSSQIAIPAGIVGGQDSGGGTKNSFSVVSATGKNIMDAGQNMQAQLSRSLFYGHRQTILIGQGMAEHGVSSFIDMFVRNPDSEMRSMVVVVKGGQAKDILAIEPIFDPFNGTTFEREQIAISLRPYYYRHFLADAVSQGTQPLLPAVSLTASKKYAYSGAAILNKEEGLKLVAFLNAKEAALANWITNRQSSFIITSSMNQADENLSLRLQSLKRLIRVKITGQRIEIDVRLKGKGTVVENNSKLDPAKKEELRLIEDKFSQLAQKSTQQLIEKVQKQYKTDIFGFGESVHRQYPRQWKTIKREWNGTFPQVQVKVQVDIKCKDPGQTSSPIKSLI
ncbi:Ger(x)C family spore germination protein [Paenibacillus sepulcri]|uniref:Ger(X)C family spore germination protein n=1 Tax=Paenibacillus sepulcri TaxID=359917 RepID=A0ABS7C4F8_9BACL|nr:Ger(x)C family spore germination protein [Paenibacillus sepulcri]